MDRRILASIVVAIIIVIVGGYFTLRPQNKPQSETANVSETNSPAPTAAALTQMSLKTLFESGGSKKCTYSDNTDNMMSSGTVYLANSKMRGDFDTQASGQTFHSHMITDQTTSYIWTDGQPQGIKMTMDKIPSPNPSAKTQSGVDINKNFNFKCDNWSADESLFTTPSDIKFQDFSSMMAPSKPGASATGNTSQCAACNSLSGDAKTQCLKALSCN